MSKFKLMRFVIVIIVLSLPVTCLYAKEDASISLKAAGNNFNMQNEYGKLPLYFIENKGQVDKVVRFYEKSSDHATFFTKDGVYLSLGRIKKNNVGQGFSPALSNPKGLPYEINENETTSQLIKLSLLNANKNPEMVAEDLQEGKVNYFIGKDPKKWKINIPTFKTVLYKEVYKGIDIKFYGNNCQLEYDIVVKPGADPSVVKFAYEGVKSLRVTESGDLEISLADGKITQKKPIVYQEINGKRVKVAGEFKVQSSKLRILTSNLKTKNSPLVTRNSQLVTAFSYSFQLASYNKSHSLVIDPVLLYSRYLGGSDEDWSYGIAVDSAGNAYLTGTTKSADFPTASPIYKDYGGGSNYGDAFVTKINATGFALVYSTYIGGSNDDIGNSIAVDSAGNAYITGITKSADFPTASPINKDYSGGSNYGDAFVAKINASGSALVYSTYLGGSNDDIGNGIAVDSLGNAYITGMTKSDDFPTASPIYKDYGGGTNYGDAFVTKINASGSALDYSTYLGGSKDDIGNGIAVDSAGNAYITGETKSTDFPEGFYNSGKNDVFVTEINASGSAIVYSTYLGGKGDDRGSGIAVDSSGNAYITGQTKSIDFPKASPIAGTKFGGIADAFVTKIKADGSGLAYSTYLGGSGDDWGLGIAVDSSGNAYITGRTKSIDFPKASPIARTRGGGISDAFVTKIKADGSALAYSTYLGGSADDWGFGIAVDSSGNAYIAGTTLSADFPKAFPIGGTIGGGITDAFVTKIKETTDTKQPDLNALEVTCPATVKQGEKINIVANVENIGTKTAPESKVSFYLSGNYDNSVDGDTELVTKSTKTIKPGKEKQVSYEWTVPSGTPVGEYYIKVFWDSENLVTESDEDNDIGVSGKVNISDKPDLNALTVKCPATVNVGKILNIVANVGNIGTETAQVSKVSFYLSGNNAHSVDGDTELVTKSIKTIQAGQGKQVSYEWKVPSGTLVGEYHIKVFWDSENVLTESDEGNNIGVSDKINIK